MDGNPTITRLLTLLNVSAIKSEKRKRTYDEHLTHSTVKLNKRKSTTDSVGDEIGGRMGVAESVETSASEPAADIGDSEIEGMRTPEFWTGPWQRCPKT
jgi:hypothetical protein